MRADFKVTGQGAWPSYSVTNAIPPLDDSLTSYSILDFEGFFGARRKLLLKRLASALSLDDSDGAEEAASGPAAVPAELATADTVSATNEKATSV